MEPSPHTVVALSGTGVLAIGVVVGFVVLLLWIAFRGYVRGKAWTGLPEHWYPKDDGIQVVARKTAWDWLQLLVVPLALALGVFLLNGYQTSRDRERDMGEHEPSDRVSDAARSVTFGVLPRLDAKRKVRVFNFLRSAGLLTVEAHEDPQQFWLRGADFTNIDMTGADLSGMRLVRLNFAGADLTDANLDGSILDQVNLSRAILSGAIFDDARLYGLNLSGADVRDARFTSTMLDDCEFTNAEVDVTDFGTATLSQTTLTP